MSSHTERLAYSPITARPSWRWSNGARLAIWIIPNIEYFPIDKPGTAIRPESGSLQPDIANHSWREYGPRVGVWRLMDALDRFGVRATVALNAAVCDHYPQILEAGQMRGWEFMGHGWTNAEPLPGLTEEAERQVIRRVRQRMQSFFGTPPRGWLGPALNETWNTPDLLKEEGFDYVCDWVHDDQPTRLRTRHGELITLPYSLEINDLPAFLRLHLTPDDFCRMICRQFDQLYEDGAQTARVMAIALHPFAIGAPFRIHALVDALRHMQGRAEVWFATGGEIVDDYLRQTAT